MANYAFGPRRLSNARNRAFMGTFGRREHDMYDEDPEAAMNAWIQRLPGLSNAARGNLMANRQSYWNAFNSADILNPLQRPEGITQSFYDYLTRLNPQREMYSQSPYARGTEARRFRQPARWTSF